MGRGMKGLGERVNENPCRRYEDAYRRVNMLVEGIRAEVSAFAVYEARD